MSTIDVSDVQGFALKGYNFPYARYLLLELLHPDSARRFVGAILPHITTGERWDEKPLTTLNIAFTHKGLVQLQLPMATLLSFPVEFQQGMRARGDILYDTGLNAPDHWDEVWQTGRVHVWLAVNAQTPEALSAACVELDRLMRETGGAQLLQSQDASAVFIDGKPTPKEHFGYTDGFGNPDFKGAERGCVPGQGKLTQEGGWEALATGEFLLGYADEAGELPVAPIPHLLARNGTFMVYRKLHQNVATFRQYLQTQGALYGGGKEKLAAKFVGRWRDGTPVELSPDHPDPAIVGDSGQNTNFTYGDDPTGARCPIGAHIRRTNPRDAFGFTGQLINRRRIMRRGLPYGEYVPEGRTGQRHGGAWNRLHGAQCQHLPPVRIRSAAVDRIRQRLASGKRQGSDARQPRGQGQVRGAGFGRRGQPAVHLRQPAELRRTARRGLLLHAESYSIADDRRRCGGSPIGPARKR